MPLEPESLYFPPPFIKEDMMQCSNVGGHRDFLTSLSGFTHSMGSPAKTEWDPCVTGVSLCGFSCLRARE